MGKENQVKSYYGFDIDYDNINVDKITNHTTWPSTKVSNFLDGIIRVVCGECSWVWLALVAVIMINVISRYVFGFGHVELEEGQWHLYSAGWMIGLSYCYLFDDHVRVDLFYEKFNFRTRAWIEFFGTIFLLAPFIFFVIRYSIPFIHFSFINSEISTSANGLPFRWALKAFIFFGFFFLAIATFSRFIRLCNFLFCKNNLKKTLANSEFCAAYPNILRELANEIGETCNISIRDGQSLFYLIRVEVGWKESLTPGIGTELPIYSSASGKLLLSSLSLSALNNILTLHQPLERTAVNTITDCEQLVGELKHIRESHIALDNEEWLDGMVGAAVPIYDVHGDLWGTLSIHSSANRRTIEDIKSLVPRLQQSAATLSQQL